MSYATSHASALKLVTSKGTSVTFTKVTTDYDGETDTHTTTSATVTGKAVRVRGRARTYEALGLIESKAPTLLFAPDTYGSEPVLGSTLSWGGTTYTVRDVEPVAPDGTAIVARVVVSL